MVIGRKLRRLGNNNVQKYSYVYNSCKAGAEKIMEVETPDTIEKDKDQQATFRRRAGQKQRTSFEVIETDD